MKKIISIILCFALMIPALAVISSSAAGSYGLHLENGMHPEIILERPGSGPYTVSFDISMKGTSPSFSLDNSYGNYSPLTFGTSSVNVMGKSYSCSWGNVSAGNWHHVDLRFNKGTGYRAGITVTFDGKVICTEEYGDSHTNGYKSDASSVMTFSVSGDVYLDNIVLDGREAGKTWCYTIDFENATYHTTFLRGGTREKITVDTPSEDPDIPDIPDIPDEPVESPSAAHPSGHGWYWDENVSYAYIVNYGGNGTNIILDVDMCFVPAIGTPKCTFLTDGASQNHVITPDSVSVGGKSVPYTWGAISKNNWHHVTYSVIGGKVTIAIDGKDIVSGTGYTANTSWQILLNNTGEMMIDNLSLRSGTGTVYFTCDYEDEQYASRLMGLYESDPGNGIWTPLGVETVEFDLNGGTGNEVGNKYKVADTPMTVPSANAEKAGYNFLGWSENKDAQSPQYKAGDSYTKDESTTLYAVWLSSSHVHSFGAWTVKTPASCTKDGLEARTCSCGEEETRTLPSAGHVSGGRVETSPATCTAPAYRTEYCKNCTEIYSKTETAPALGHNFKVTENAATAAVHGGKVYSCTRCPCSFETETAAPTGTSAVYAAGKVNEDKTELTVEILISGNEGLNSLGIELGYNPDALTFKGYENGEVFCESTGGSMLMGKTTANPLKMLFDDDEIDNNTQNGTLATLTFEIKDASAPFALTLAYNPKNTLRVNSSTSAAYAEIGDVFVDCRYCADDPGVETTIPGDLDFDGKLTAKDLNILKSMFLGTVGGTGKMKAAGDLNGDGKITLVDVNIHKSLLTGSM